MVLKGLNNFDRKKSNFVKREVFIAVECESNCT